MVWVGMERHTQVEVLEYPELGMEAVWKIDVENFPAFIVVDGKGDCFTQTWALYGVSAPGNHVVDGGIKTPRVQGRAKGPSGFARRRCF